MIEKLFLHFHAANLTDAENRLVVRDWLEDLADYPADIIAEACRLWRASGERWRPQTAGVLMAPILGTWRFRRMIADRAAEVIAQGPFLAIAAPAPEPRPAPDPARVVTPRFRAMP